MPVIINKELILVDAKQIDITDRQTGEKIKKWKYTFLTPDNKLVVGYDANGLYKNEVKVVAGWEKAKAKNYAWELTMFQGITKEKLFVGQLPKV